MAEEVLTDSFQHSQRALHVTRYGAQYRRQRVSDTWQPAGFSRYPYQKALLDAMPVLGGADDGLLRSPEDYRPASECSETLDCTCRRP